VSGDESNIMNAQREHGLRSGPNAVGVTRARLVVPTFLEPGEAVVSRNGPYWEWSPEKLVEQHPFAVSAEGSVAAIVKCAIHDRCYMGPTTTMNQSGLNLVVAVYCDPERRAPSPFAELFRRLPNMVDPKQGEREPS
jgi:hypothetical protein